MPLIDLIKSGAADFDTYDLDTQKEVVTATRDALLSQLDGKDWDDAKKDRARVKIAADTRSSLRDLTYKDRAEQELGEGRYAPTPIEETHPVGQMAASVLTSPVRVLGGATSFTGLVTYGLGALTDTGLDAVGMPSGDGGKKMGQDIMAEGAKMAQMATVFRNQHGEQALGEQLFDSFSMGAVFGAMHGAQALSSPMLRAVAPDMASRLTVTSAFGNAAGDLIAEGAIKVSDKILDDNPEIQLSPEGRLALRAGIGLFVGTVAGVSVEARLAKTLGSPKALALIEDAAKTPKGMTDDDWLNSPDFMAKLKKAALSVDEPHPLEVKFVDELDKDLPDWLIGKDTAVETGPTRPRIGRVSIEDAESPYGYTETLGVESKAIEEANPDLALFLRGISSVDDADVRSGVFSVERIMSGLHIGYRNLGPFAGNVDSATVIGKVLRPLEDLFETFAPLRPKNEDFLIDAKALLDTYKANGKIDRLGKYKFLNGIRRLAELPDTFIRGILPREGARVQGSYNPLANLLETSVERPELFGHEIGHFVWWHQLSGNERIGFAEAIGKLSKEDYLNIFPMNEAVRAKLLSATGNTPLVGQAADELQKTLGWVSRPTEFYAQVFGHYMSTNQLPVAGTESLLGKGLRAARSFFLDQKIQDLPPELQQYFSRVFLSPNPSLSARKVSTKDFATIGLSQSAIHPANLNLALERVAQLESELDGTWQRFEVAGEVKERGQFAQRTDDAGALAAQDAVAADPGLQRSMVQAVTQQAVSEGWSRMLGGVEASPELALSAAKVAGVHIYDLPQLLELWLVKRAHGIESVSDAEIRMALGRLDAALLPQNYDNLTAQLKTLLKGPSEIGGVPVESVDAATGVSYTRSDLARMSEDELMQRYVRGGEEERVEIDKALLASRKSAREYRLAQEAHQAQSNRISIVGKLENAYDLGMRIRQLPTKSPERAQLIEQFNKILSDVADISAYIPAAFPAKGERKFASQLVTLLGKFSTLKENTPAWKAARKAIMDHYSSMREGTATGETGQNLARLTNAQARQLADHRTVAQIAAWELQDMRRALEAYRACVGDYYDLIRMTEQPNNASLRQVMPNYIQHAINGITSTPNTTTWKLARNRIAAQLVGFGGGLEFDDNGSLTFNPTKWLTSGFFLANLGPRNVLRTGKYLSQRIAEKIMANSDVIRKWTALDVDRIANYPYRRIFGGLREDRGLSPQHAEVLRALKDFEAGKNAVADTMNRLAKSLANEFTLDERKIISDVIEEEGEWMHYGQIQKYENAVRDIRQHYTDVRKMMQEAGTVPELVDFDMLSDRYLNRVYLRADKDFSGRMADVALHKLHYNYLRMRGLEEVVKVNSAPHRQLTGQMGGIENIAIGDKIKTYNAGASDQPRSMQYFHEKSGRRPEAHLILAPGSEWKVKSVDSKGDITLWRDYTPEERAFKNEQRDVVARIMAFGKAVSEDFALAKLFKRIGDMKDVVFDPHNSGLSEDAVVNKLRDLTEYPLNHQRWVTVPKTTDKELGIPIYGELAGKLVHPEVFNILKSVSRGKQIDNLPDAWRAAHRLAWKPYVGALRLWKVGKTALNPVAHVNNWMGNSLMTYINGYNPLEVMSKGISSFAKKDNFHRDAEVHMLLDTTMLRAELDTQIFGEILDDFRRGSAGAESDSLSAIAVPGYMSKAMGLALKGAKATGRGLMGYSDAMQQAYQYGDYLWKLGLYRKLRESNWTEQAAIEEVNRLFFDYRHVPSGVKFLRDSGLAPFITYTYKAIPVVAKALIDRPERVLGTFLMAEAFTQVMYKWEYGDNSKAVREYHDTVSPDWAKGKTFGMFNFRVPIHFDGDKVTNFDMSRWFPAGDLFEQGGPLASYPFAFNPFIATLFGAATDMDPTFMREFAKSGDLDDPRVDAAKWEAKKKFILNTWLPNLPIPFTYSFSGDKIGEALTSAGVMPRDVADGMGWTGKDYAWYDINPGQSILGAFGLKSQTVDPSVNFTAQMRYLRAQISREKNELQKSLRSPRSSETERAESIRRFDSARATGIEEIRKLQNAKAAAERTPGFAR